MGDPEADAGRWHLEVFDTPEQATSFLNHVALSRDQLVDVQFQALGPTAQRVLLTCRLTATQLDLRDQWLAVERVLGGGDRAPTS